jgi:hypothetical protein
MKKTVRSILISLFLTAKLSSQTIESEKHGNSLNGGVGIGYFGYIGHTLPVFHADYEFQIDNNLTLAPSLNLFSYEKNYIWANKEGVLTHSHYNEVVVPLGVKVSYYLDHALKLNHKWDLYLAGSLGFNIRSTKWEDSYTGTLNINPGTGPLYLDFHSGVEYHLNKTMGLQIDLSTTVSSFGFAIHL